jgi:hypothetical protein
MANNQNNETANTVGLAVAFCVFMVIGFGVIVIAIAAFATLLALLSQIKPIRFQGEVITAKEGRWFIWRGMMGTIPCAALLLQVAAWFEITVTKEWTWFVIALAYSISALAIAWFVETFWNEDKPVQVTPPPPSARAQILPPTKTQSYEFASWDDEDADPYK